MADIRKEVAKALKKNGKALGFKASVLTVKTPGTRTPGSEASGTNPTSVSYPCSAMVDTAVKLMDGTLVAEGNSRLSIVGGSLPTGVRPIPGRSTVLRAAVTYKVVRVAFDSVEAMYECEVAH